MSFIVTNQSRNIWDEVCKEVAALDPTRDPVSTLEEEPVQRIEYNSSTHHPAIYGKTLKHDTVDGNALKDFNPELFHPALAGLVEVRVCECVSIWSHIVLFGNDRSHEWLNKVLIPKFFFPFNTIRAQHNRHSLKVSFILIVAKGNFCAILNYWSAFALSSFAEK